MNRFTKYFKWFLRPTMKPVYPSNVDKIQKLKKKIKALEYRMEGLENEMMIIMKEYRHLINTLEMRIDTLNEGCEKCTKN